MFIALHTVKKFIPRLTWCAVVLVAAWQADCASLKPAAVREPAPVVRPEARMETVPVPHRDDAADDPAIWIHPTAPEQSLILGTDKQGTLQVYEPDGSLRQAVGEGTMPNNVDVLYGFKLGGATVDLAVASTRGAKARGLTIWTIDPVTRRLAEATDGGVIAVFGGGEPYGCGAHRSAKDGAAHVFVTAKDGAVEQWRLAETSGGRITARKVRSLKLQSTPEGCVADEELGAVYFGEEGRGVWKFAAEPGGGTRGELIARVGEHGLAADVEGLALYGATGGRGYLIVSSQGNHSFKVYERKPPHRFVLTIDPRAARFGDVEDTDGIAVTSRPMSRVFPRGLFIAQDGENGKARQNFKLFAWEDIAGTNLIVDTQWSPRRRR